MGLWLHLYIHCFTLLPSPCKPSILHPLQYTVILSLSSYWSALFHTSIFILLARFFTLLFFQGKIIFFPGSTRISLRNIKPCQTLGKNKIFSFHYNVLDHHFNHKITTECISSLTTLINIFLFKTPYDPFDTQKHTAIRLKLQFLFPKDRSR